MAFNIETFRSEIHKTGVAKQNSFDMTITLPRALKGILNRHGIGGTDARTLSLRCESVDMPGRTLQTVDYVTDWGAMRRIPYRPMYVDIGATIVCSEDLREKVFFEAWQDIAVGSHRFPQLNPQRIDSLNESSTGNSVSEMDQFGIGYYEDYVSTIEMTQYDATSKETYSLVAIEAYPIIVSPLQSNWSSEDIHRVQVQFSYRFFKDGVIANPSTITINTPGPNSTLERPGHGKTMGDRGAGELKAMTGTPAPGIRQSPNQDHEKRSGPGSGELGINTGSQNTVGDSTLVAQQAITNHPPTTVMTRGRTRGRLNLEPSTQIRNI